MKKFKVTVDGKSYVVEVEEIAENPAPPLQPAPAAPKAAPEASTAPKAAPEAPAEPKSAPEAKPEIDRFDESDADFQVVAPMPGSIIEIKVKEGEVVAAGAVLLTLEAMKMENEITSVHAGTVSKVLVREGDAVNTGDPLVLLVRS